MTLATFTNAYIECALWSSTDDAGNPLNSLDADLSDKATTKLKAEAAAFYAEHSDKWAGSDADDSQAGHDFWLTRNGHGAGFWDRPELYGQSNADALTAAAKACGERDLYVSDCLLIEVM